MGSSFSQFGHDEAAPITAPEPSSNEVSEPLHGPDFSEPPVHFMALPPELLSCICSELSLPALSALACTCSETGCIADDVWRQQLRRLLDTVGGVPASLQADNVDQPHSTSHLSTAQREVAVRRAAQLVDAAQFNSQVAIRRIGASSPRVHLGMLRELVCAMCDSAPATDMCFAETRRGVCRGCIRTKPSEADEWRYHQSARESRAVEARDAKIGSLLRASLDDSLPLALRGVPPRLRFSSDLMGGSLASLLRAADHVTSCLILVFSEQGFAFGAFCPVPLPKFPNERPTAWFGDPSAFLFGLTPELRVCASTGRDEHFFRCDGDRGLSIGGDDELPALRIASDLGGGRCLPSHTFGDSSRLAPSTDFSIQRVQLWDLTPPDPDANVAAISVTEEIENGSILVGRSADAMMLPFRTSVMMRVE